MEGFKQGVVNRCDDGLFPYQAWATVCRDEKGVLYAVSSGHRIGHICPFGKNLMYVSYDEGETWSPPVIINDTVLDDRDAGITALGDGKLLLTYFDREMDFYIRNRDSFVKGLITEKRGMYDAALAAWETKRDHDRPGSFVRLSRDSGKTWEPAVQVPVTSPHGPIRLANGKLLFLGKEFPYEDDKGPVKVYESADDGMTWTYLSTVDFPDGCTAENIHEPDVVELPDGTLLGALRGQGKEVAYGFSVFTCFSYDGGRTWTHPEALDICGSPPHLLLHSSGAVVMTFGRRAKPYGERARISYDGGKTFDQEVVLFDGAPEPDLGYPSSVELSDGSILTVYYQKMEGDNFCSILSTRWELPPR